MSKNNKKNNRFVKGLAITTTGLVVLLAGHVLVKDVLDVRFVKNANTTKPKKETSSTTSEKESIVEAINEYQERNPEATYDDALMAVALQNSVKTKANDAKITLDEYSSLVAKFYKDLQNYGIKNVTTLEAADYVAIINASVIANSGLTEEVLIGRNPQTLIENAFTVTGRISEANADAYEKNKNSQMFNPTEYILDKDEKTKIKEVEETVSKSIKYSGNKEVQNTLIEELSDSYYEGQYYGANEETKLAVLPLIATLNVTTRNGNYDLLTKEKSDALLGMTQIDTSIITNTLKGCVYILKK